MPEVGVSINDNIFKRVDLPEPEGPIIEYIFPALNEKFNLLRTLTFFLES